MRFSSVAERDEALKLMDGHIIGNHPIRVSKATLKKYQADGELSVQLPDYAKICLGFTQVI